LASVNLSKYGQLFAENDIDFTVLRDLTDQDFKELGISLGHRRKLLRAIAELSNPSPASPAAAPATRDAAERRQLTVLFCDLVDSTELSLRLDPEELGKVIGAYHRISAEVIEKSGGVIASYLGDGVMAYFGHPYAHEDDAERAVRAGLALIEAVAKIDHVPVVAVRARVGIATGLVVVGDYLREGAAGEHDVLGGTPNLAARLQTIAETDTVIIDGNTRRLLGELFEYRALGAVSLKGFREAVPAWQAIRASAVGSRFEALRATTTPLVGRNEELELLMRRWQQARSGEGCMVLITGEPGIGKSRLVETLLERLTSEPHTPLRLFCSPHHQDSPLYPSIAQLGRAAGFRRDDTVKQRLDKLEALLSQVTNDLSEVVPLLSSLLSIPTGDRYAPLNLSPQKQKEKTLKTLLAQVEGLAARQPVVIVVEDMQWGDPTSREWFDLLVDRVPALSVLVICTFRPEFTPPWVGRPQVTLISLNRLPPRYRAEMITYLTGNQVLPKEIADQIIDRTDGVPLFIEELTKAVVESGALREAGDQYNLDGPLPPQTIPTSLHASLLARLDRLAPARELVQIASALGRHFSHELISAVAAMSQQQVDASLEQLVRAELILRRGTPPDALYTFKHALVQDAAYSTMLHSRCQQLHARITATLEGQFPEIAEMQPELLAQHCTQAGLIEKAVGYWLKAGQQAIKRWTMTEAVALVRKGLNLVSDIPDSVKGQGLELDLELTLGHALLATKGYGAPEPQEAYVRARELCTKLGRPPQLARVLVGQYLLCAIRGELLEAERHADEIRHLGKVWNEPIWKFTGANLSGIICKYLGKFIDARAHTELAVSLWDPRFRASAASPTDSFVSAMTNLSRTLICLGYADQARLWRDKALAEARRLGSPYTLAWALCNAGHNDWAIEGMKSAPRILRAADEVLAISNEQSFPLLLAVGNVMRGWSLSALGQTSEGIPQLTQGLAVFRAAGSNLLLPFYLTTLAEAHGWATQPDKGLARLTEANQLMEITHECWVEAEMHRVQGTLLASMLEHAAAEDSFLRALTVARRQSAKYWELRAAFNLAQVWRGQGKRAEARELLLPIYGWFTEGFDTSVLQDAKALLDQLV
jgi:class 3 adenylate cyclase/tetratricopeptide (TPR) repeat protein